MADLAGRVALVTGGGDGVGRGIVNRLAAAGAAVVIAEFDAEKGRAAEAEVRAAGGTAAFVRCDVTRREEMEGAVAEAIGRFGGIHILVNNAYRGGVPDRIENLDDDRFRASLDINLMAAKWSMTAAYPAMREQGWGRIVNVASLNGVNAHMGTADYNVGKEALRALTRSAAREWAPFGICANIICPAAISSAFRQFAQYQPEVAAGAARANPMHRMGDPERDIGGVVLFLVGEDARYLTGNTLFVDGGAHINGVAWVPDIFAGD
ncbi:SDR family NAD(P)-dependent oxidoreductase [Sphingomonas fennica]|uniref:Oxidoreductase n=1 Tax=Edaphosphingomonas fennica TaxID=114404 RepID=A0A2T4HW49_9SPHN|nr:SDR family oxidoreductase [Sphingomonas fennica]PTD19980.1 oxidoreductase [Sphingomonas fennica]